MIDKGQWRELGQDTGVPPLLFTRSAMGFLMTTESQDLGLTSHPKDGALSQYSVPVTILGHWDPHRLEGDTGVNSQTSPVPLPQKLISSRPNPTKKLGENPVPSTPGRMTPIPSHSRVVVFFFRLNLSVTVKI